MQKRIAVQKGEKMPMFGVPPAADAGPRCTVCLAPIYHSSLAGWSHYHPPDPKHEAAPPVPQEAAPQCPDCKATKRNACENAWHLEDEVPATAPDEAMRVAREIKDVLRKLVDYDNTYSQSRCLLPIGRQGAAMTLRRDFEDEARKRGWPLGRIGELANDPTYDRDKAEYANIFTRARWEVWQAAGELYGAGQE